MSKTMSGGQGQFYGVCNKCGYIGWCSVGSRRSLVHFRPDGKVCSYSAVPITNSDAERIKSTTPRDAGEGEGR